MERNTMILDGNTAAAHVAYSYSDVAFIYPITPATSMAEQAEQWSANNVKNIFGQSVSVTQMQSEAGVAGAMHGALCSGALTSTYTASQGLLLMIPNIYKMAGEHLPGVIYVASRSIATHALSIFGDHSDIYAARQTGACIFSVSNVQEVMDLAPVAHISALIGQMPVIFFFDGFRTSHEAQKISTWSIEDLANLMPNEYVQAFKAQSLNPNHPKVMGSAQNPDVFFQVREASNISYLAMPEIVSIQIDKINSLLGTNYSPYEYYGSPEAEHVIIAMGSVIDTIKETADYLNANGHKVGVLNVRLFRPFSASKLIEALPKSVKTISVLDRTKEPGSVGEPLYQDVATALSGSSYNVILRHGRYGLASKDTTPSQIAAVYANDTKKEFTIGINDDVTNLSLNFIQPLDLDVEQYTCLKFYGRGSDGTIGSVKAAARIIGEHTPNYVQVYSEYDSKVSGSLTTSHLRFGDSPVRAPYLINKAHFIACNHFRDLEKFDLYTDLLENGSLLINCPYSADELSNKLSDNAKHYLSSHSIHIYTIDDDKLCRQIGLGRHINTMLITAAFCILQLMPDEECASLLKEYVWRAYHSYGDNVLRMNNEAIDCARENLRSIDIPSDWGNAIALDSGSSEIVADDYYSRIQKPILDKRGDEIPVSALLPYSDGSSPSGTAANDKPGNASYVAIWNKNKCLQCNHCSFVCPHAAIRPYAITPSEADNAPAKLKHSPLTGAPKYRFTIGVSVLDCTGCGTCLSKCPSAGKALRMAPLDKAMSEQDNYNYLESLPKKPEIAQRFRVNSVKGSQFVKPLMEFPGACGGCAETAYARLLTQLFGERMYIANATGCSSIWGNSMPNTPYTISSNGRGPVWSNSLFEDAAEFGYGMMLAHNHIRDGLKEKLTNLQNKLPEHDPLRASIKAWLDTYSSGSLNLTATDDLCHQLKNHSSLYPEDIMQYQDYLSKKSQWIFGGDGWAYDIGSGGLDHVLASGQDINIIVFDTECYSNTGGQASKSTPIGAIAKFTSAGKSFSKKDLSSLALNYKNVYVASISMGADMNQCIKAMTEAEAHNGPSLLLAYAPCKHHGLRGGAASAQKEQELAVACGYRTLFRYNPDVSPAMQIDAHPDYDKLDEFLSRETRYSIDNYPNADYGAQLHSQLREDIIEASNTIYHKQ